MVSRGADVRLGLGGETRLVGRLIWAGLSRVCHPLAVNAIRVQVIVAQSPNVLHWSAEARKQAAANARESSRMLHEREAGSAKCTPLPPKVRVYG